MSTALLLIDIQNDYFPGGAMELVGSVEAGEQAGSLLAACRAQGLPVIHIQHLANQAGATFFRPGTPGAAIHACVAPAPGEVVFQKHYPSSFRETGLLAHLREQGIDALIVAGMMTHMCIDTTVRAAFDLGFTCTLAHDACATRDLAFGGRSVAAADVHTAFIAALNRFARLQSSSEIRAQLEATPR